jgi:O-antigen ligase
MVTARKVLEKLIYLFTFSLLFFSPLLIGSGSAKPWTKLVLQIQCFLIFILWLLWSSYEEMKLNLSTKSHLLLLAFLFICLFQIVPLPRFILGTVSQKSLEIWERSQSVLSDVGFNRENSMFTISLYPHGTWKETLLLLSYFAFGFVISRMFRAERQIKLLLIPVFGVLLFEAAYGIYQYLTRDTTLPLEVQYARGTFLNRNHFAGFLEMSLPLVLGYALSIRGRHKEKQKSFFKTLASSDNLLKQILLLFLLGIMFLALFFSKSRMGIFSALLSLLFFYLVYSSLKKSKLEKAWMIFFVLAIAILYGLWIGLSPIFERFLRIEAQAPGRILVWKDTLGIIKDFPFFGTGLGTFGYVYPLYEKSMEQALLYIHAHNDYLQLMAETGLLGFLFIFIALVLFIFSSLKTLSQLSQKEDYFRFFITLGALSGIVSLLIHSLADFNLHIPSNALYFAFLIGFSKATCAESKGQRQDL